MRPSVLIVTGHDKAVGSRFEKKFRPIGEVVSELSHLNTIVKERAIELILIDSDFPGVTPAVVRKLRIRAPMTDIWEIADRVDYQVEDREPGLFDGTVDPAGDVSKAVSRILYRKALLRKFGMVGRSEKMKLVAETIERVAPTDISILIVGPSGSGKELVARAIHNYSTRSDRRFVAINCGALAEGILESELFGHERGAFTGSVGKRDGLFIQADGGSIFLDEIGETKPDIQVKLLRVLEDGVFYPVGGDRSVRSDVRVIVATNRDLTEAIHDGFFREDLYFRLGVVKIILPPLHDRREDILPLLYHFAERESSRGFSDNALDLLVRYDWPGNVRQLKNFISRMAALHPDDLVTKADVEQFIAEQDIGQTHLPVATGNTPEEAGHELIYHALLSLGNEVKMLRDLIIANLPAHQDFETGGVSSEVTPREPGVSIQDMERELIVAALRETDGNRKETAKRLGIGERTLYRKLNKYNLN